MQKMNLASFVSLFIFLLLEHMKIVPERFYKDAEILKKLSHLKLLAFL
ncbi:hypothetical protein G436_4650 [Leptospira interrogans serovar Hardjo str. Norma]|uniref:Uncharacterized protein n=2 Tax=Leptospira TaxID=171 RepID=M6F7B1_9LEPT|nr:hypothetical protein G436_4650 [Leptospira interrogans serovar Hardjo str. Norma]EMK22907.1 hypothetical protein LEP1GSC008_0692 [Leptospira kirschneri serovar Bulgarica str. Nikolaevo]OCA01650.1 Uncharacterized protein A9P81_0212 [Leptospira interrogans serovar Copenhageni/Icterohaemorrhagiae]